MAYINGKKILFSPNVNVTEVKNEVVQTTGYSETAVMSQKAVSSLFGESPLNVGEFTEGTYIHTNGSEQSASDTKSTDYIEVKTGTKVKIANAYLYGNRSICGYDMSKNFVKLFVSNTNDTEFVIERVPPNVKFIRFSCVLNAVPSVVQFSNLDRSDVYIDDITFNKEEFVSGYISDFANGLTITPSTDYACSPYIAVCPLQEIEMCWFCPVMATAVFLYDENKKFIGRIEDSRSGELIAHDTFVMPVDAYFIRIHTYSNKIGNLSINYTKPVYHDAIVSTLVNGWFADTYKRTAKILKTATSKPIITFIDDDTTTIEAVTRFRNVCTELGIKGCFATITNQLDTQNGLVEKLLEFEREGFHILTHCNEQGDFYSHDTRNLAACENDLVTALQKMKKYGFTDYKFWCTPFGVTDEDIRGLANKWGMNCTVLSGCMKYESVKAEIGRHAIQRMSLNPTDEVGFGIQDIKNQIDDAYINNGWVLITTHMAESGWTNNLDRFRELVNYALEKGFEVKTLNEAWRIREPIYRLYETF